MKKPYAVLRIEKRKDRGSITRSNNHNHRIGRLPKNVAPGGPPPRLLAGCADCPAELANRTPGKPRKNAVLAVEFVLTASPEWFATATPAEYAAWVEKNTAWIQQELGSNFVQAVLHECEKTPHIHAYGSCVVDGSLNFAKMYGTPAKLIALQDRYAAAMKPFGLKRGERGSKATHTEIRGMAEKMDRLEKGLDAVVDALNTLAKHVNTLAGVEALRTVQNRVAEGLGKVAPAGVRKAPARGRGPLLSGPVPDGAVCPSPMTVKDRRPRT